jgi:hypothetical protein
MEGPVAAEAMKAGVATTAAMAGGKRSAWMAHVKKTMKANKGKSLSQVLKMAKKTYKKTAKGGGLSPLPLSGGRRHSRKTVKGGRKH